MMPRRSLACALITTVAALVTASSAAVAGDLRVDVQGLSGAAEAFVFAGPAAEPVPGRRDGSAFLWTGLAPGAVSVEIISGSLHVIGVDMRVLDPAGAALAAWSLDADAAAPMLTHLKSTEDFFTSRRMPLVFAAGDRAVALVENVQSGESTTHAESRNKVILRVDAWDFEKSFGSWRKVKSRVLLRRSIDKASFDASTFAYAPELGGIMVPDSGTFTVSFHFPSAPSSEPAPPSREEKR